MAVHKPSIVWLTRRLGHYPNQAVRTVDETSIEIGFYGVGGLGYGVGISRADARLLARRINRCLDETRSR